MAEIFAGAVALLILGFLWFWVVRPIAIDFGLLRVSVEPAAHSVELHRADEQTGDTDRRADSALSEHDRLWREFSLDRKRARLIAVMVDSEIPVAEIRGLLKGDNTVISQEVAEARKYLGLTPPEEYRTPIAKRSTQAAFQEVDPELAREPLP